MKIEKITLISVNKTTKEKVETIIDIDKEITLDKENFKYYCRLEAFKDYYIIYNDDIHSHCLSIFKKVNSIEDIKSVNNYTYELKLVIDEELMKWEKEQEELAKLAESEEEIEEIIE